MIPFSTKGHQLYDALKSVISDISNKSIKTKKSIDFQRPPGQVLLNSESHISGCPALKGRGNMPGRPYQLAPSGAGTITAMRGRVQECHAKNTIFCAVYFLFDSIVALCHIGR